MLSEAMQAALNEQIKMEGYASFLYLSMASWCDREGLEGCTQFLRRQSAEENEHMLRLFDYFSDVDAHAITPAIPQPPREFESVRALFEEVYAHEQKVTNSIHELVALSMEERDHTTHHFLQWYIEEQKEEEALMRTILDRIKLIGNGPQHLYYIDLEMEKINEQALADEGAGG